MAKAQDSPGTKSRKDAAERGRNKKGTGKLIKKKPRASLSHQTPDSEVAEPSNNTATDSDAENLPSQPQRRSGRVKHGPQREYKEVSPVNDAASSDGSLIAADSTREPEEDASEPEKTTPAPTTSKKRKRTPKHQPSMRKRKSQARAHNGDGEDDSRAKDETPTPRSHAKKPKQVPFFDGLRPRPKQPTPIHFMVTQDPSRKKRRQEVKPSTHNAFFDTTEAARNPVELYWRMYDRRVKDHVHAMHAQDVDMFGATSARISPLGHPDLILAGLRSTVHDGTMALQGLKWDGEKWTYEGKVLNYGLGTM